MRGFKRGEEPNSLRKARKRFKNWDDATGSDLGAQVKNDIRRSLFKAQRGCCAYCEVRLGDGFEDCSAHIEHLQRRSRKPQLTFDWNNLFLSCNAKDSCGIYKDEKRVDFDVNDIVDPSREDPQDFFDYSIRNGQIIPLSTNATVERRANETIRVFNLAKSPRLRGIRLQIAKLVGDFLACSPTNEMVDSFLTTYKDASCFSVFCALLGRKTQEFDD